MTMSHATLRARIAALPPIDDWTELFTGIVDERRASAPSRWYRTQQEHWLGWLADMDGPGAYDRAAAATPPTAATVYGRIVNPAMLVWLVEASGLDAERAVNVAIERTTMAGMSAAIRKAFPWNVVEAAITTDRRS